MKTHSPHIFVMYVKNKTVIVFHIILLLPWALLSRYYRQEPSTRESITYAYPVVWLNDFYGTRCVDRKNVFNIYKPYKSVIWNPASVENGRIDEI